MFNYDISEINWDIKKSKRVKYGDTRPQNDSNDVSNSNSSLEIQKD